MKLRVADNMFGGNFVKRSRRQIREENIKKMLPEFLFLLAWSPCKILEPYNNPFWNF
jgi:hypothetical protein